MDKKDFDVEELTKPDPTSMRFVRYTENGSEPITLQDLNEWFEDCKLKPEVPSEIEKIMEVSKHLFLYGYFYYPFFIVSGHIALLGLEAAMRRRFVMSLPSEITISYKNNKEELFSNRLVIKKLSFETLVNTQKTLRDRYGKGTFSINNEVFPNTFYKLIKWCGEKKIVKEDAIKHLDNARNLRNSYAHPDFQSIMPPGPSLGVIKNTIELINLLFE